ncbi:HNH endonuclease signature motif containing protein [Streptomyces sp. NBC_00207]|uniref:HNH endonuclease signature motif containing protein n=1 Tax=Streptomyces sp. NBC_00207 TaxID=2903635 RepID=UPI003250CA87
MKITDSDRFWSHVAGDSADDCWLWTSSLGVTGYGRFKFRGRAVRAHRYAYEALRSEIPGGLVLDHLCRNRACVNPWHLEPVSQRANVLRGGGVAAQAAAKTHCPQGHPYDSANTIVSSEGYRRCRTCCRIADRLRRAAK